MDERGDLVARLDASAARVGLLRAELRAAIAGRDEIMMGLRGGGMTLRQTAAAAGLSLARTVAIVSRGLGVA